MSNRLSSEEKLSAALQAAKGLAALHEADIIHGDFAARNILARHKMDKNGDYVLDFAVSDWGLALPKGSNWPAGPAPTLWSSPEVLGRTQPIQTSTDAWSFGIFLLEILEPHGNINNILKGPADYRSKILTNNEYPKVLINQYLKNNNLTLDEDVMSLIFSCLDADPAKRPTAQEIIQTLERYQDEGKTLAFVKPNPT